MKPKKRLAIVTSHPIQYNAPLFKAMNDASNIFTVKVFYTCSQLHEKVFDKEFGLAFNWDIPLLDGYEYTFVKNVSSTPGTDHFNGINNPTLIKEIEDWEANALLVFRWSFFSHLKAIRYFHQKIPVLFRGDSTLIDEPPGYSLKKIARRLFLRWVYSYVDRALYVGSASKEYFLAHGMSAKQLIFSPHAIDNARFSSQEFNYGQKAQELRNTLGINEKDIVFLFAGKLSKKKDPELLIKSFLGLQVPGKWLVLVGNGELESQLKASYQSYNNIIFINFQNQSLMPVVYRLGNVVVLPSKGPGETWGLAINEAMASNRAVIASDRCGCSYDLIINGKNGYIFEAGNTESLREVMKIAAQRSEEFGRDSEKRIQDWSYLKTVNQLNTFFQK